MKIKKLKICGFFTILPVVLLILTSCNEKSNSKKIDLESNISIKNTGEELEVYKDGVLTLRISLIGNSGQVIVLDSGDEISKLNWFYGSNKIDHFVDYKSKTVHSNESSAP